MTFDTTFTRNSDNNDNTTSLWKKIIVGGAIALLLGVASYSSNGDTMSRGGGFRQTEKNLLQNTELLVNSVDTIGMTEHFTEKHVSATYPAINDQRFNDKRGA